MNFIMQKPKILFSPISETGGSLKKNPLLEGLQGKKLEEVQKYFERIISAVASKLSRDYSDVAIRLDMPIVKIVGTSEEDMQLAKEYRQSDENLKGSEFEWWGHYTYDDATKTHEIEINLARITAEPTSTLREKERILSVIHETVHYQGDVVKPLEKIIGIETKGMRQLDDGVCEMLARKIAGEEFDIKNTESKQYEGEVSVARALATIIGEDTIYRSFLSGDIEPIKAALEKKVGAHEILFDIIKGLDKEEPDYTGIVLMIVNGGKFHPKGETSDKPKPPEDKGGEKSGGMGSRKQRIASFFGAGKKQELDETLANQTRDTAIGFMNQVFGRDLKPDDMRIVVASTSEQFVRALEAFGLEKDAVSRDALSISDSERLIVINREAVVGRAGSSRRAQLAEFRLAVLYEMVKQYTGFANLTLNIDGKPHFANVEIINDAYTEIYARHVMKQFWRKDHKGLAARERTLGEEIVRLLREGAGPEVIRTAFVKGDFRQVYDRLAAYDARSAERFLLELEGMDSKARIGRAQYEEKIELMQEHLGDVAKGRETTTASLSEIGESLDSDFDYYRTPQFVRKAWENLRIAYPSQRARKDVPEVLWVELDKKLPDYKETKKYWKNTLEVLFFAHDRTITVNPIRLDGRSDYGRMLLDQTILGYACDIWGKDVFKGDYKMAVFLALKEVLTENFYSKIGKRYKPRTIDEERMSVIGRKLQYLLGKNEAVGIFLEGGMDAVSKRIGELHGKNAEDLFRKGQIYFEQSETSLQITLHVIENLNSAASAEGRVVAPHLNYGQFREKFETTPYQATYEIMAHALPNLPPYYRSLATAAVLAYQKEEYGEVLPERIAATALVLSTVPPNSHNPKQQVLYGLFFGIEDPIERYNFARWISLKMQENIVNKGDNISGIFDGISNTQELESVYNEMVPKMKGEAFNAETRKWSESLAAKLSSQKPKPFAFTLTNPSMVNEEYNREVLAGAREYYLSQLYYVSGNPSKEEFLRLGEDVNLLLNEFALEAARLNPSVASEIDQELGLRIATLVTGQKVPTLENFGNVETDIDRKRELLTAVNNANARVDFSDDSVLFDSRNYNVELASLIKKIVDANPIAANSFLRVANLGAECAAGTTHFNTP